MSTGSPGVQLLLKYFPVLSEKQLAQFEQLEALYESWNDKINVISRKDLSHLYERHVLHSLAIAKFISLRNGTRVLDFGTGGGFPGIPLAILFPGVQFTLIDSVGKKIRVAEEIATSLALENIDFVVGRVEQLDEKFHFITCRAVAPLEQIYRWTWPLLDQKHQLNAKPNGYLLLKGGDLRDEAMALHKLNKRLHIETLELATFFEEAFFGEKKLVYIH